MDQAILISMPGGGELIIILVIVLILFGAKRIPEIASGLGKGIREFKKTVVDDPLEYFRCKSSLVFLFLLMPRH